MEYKYKVPENGNIPVNEYVKFIRISKCTVKPTEFDKSH